MQSEYVRKYNKENYEQVIIRLKKGEKEKLQKRASDCGMSLNSFIIDKLKCEDE